MRDPADWRPHTGPQFRQRAATLMATARALPRFGATLMARHYIEQAYECLAEAERLDALEPVLGEHLWDIDRRAAAAFGERVRIRPSVPGGPNRKARRAEAARERRA